MRGKNFKVLGFLFVLGIIFVSMNFVSAGTQAFVIQAPVNNANVTGTFTANATVTAFNTTNLTVRWWNGTLGNWALLCSNSTNSSNANLSITCSTDTSALNVNVSSSIFNITAIEAGDAVAANSTNKTGVVVDNTAPTVFLLDYVNGTIRNNTNMTINISFVDINLTAASPCIVNVNGTNQTIASTAINNTYRTCNTTTLSLKSMSDGNATISIYTGRNTTGWNSSLFGVAATFVVFIDAIGPTVELSATSITKDTITIAISATDQGTGVSSCTVDRAGATVTGTTSLTESGLSCAASYTYVVTCSDKNGHAASETITVSTNACGGAASSGGASRPAVTTFSQITPGVASITKYSDSTLGVKEISITVNNPAQNVQVTVTKYDSKPAAVSVSKSGKVYQYVQINTQNLAGNLDKATVQFRAEKSWVTSNGLSKDKVSVYKFDEANSKWNELQTTVSGEDNTHYYYTAELDSFSYFAISERSLAAGEGTTATGETPTEEGEGGRSLMWLWILIVVVIVVAVWLGMRKKQQ